MSRLYEARPTKILEHRRRLVNGFGLPVKNEQQPESALVG
jgi:hypothetical protein